MALSFASQLSNLRKLGLSAKHSRAPSSLAKPEKLENGGLFLRFGLSNTLIRHENGAFRKTLFKLEEFENAGSKMTGDCCRFKFLLRNVDGE